MGLFRSKKNKPAKQGRKEKNLLWINRAEATKKTVAKHNNKHQKTRKLKQGQIDELVKQTKLLLKKEK